MGMSLAFTGHLDIARKIKWTRHNSRHWDDGDKDATSESDRCCKEIKTESLAVT